jgi:hypothetical protein
MKRTFLTRAAITMAWLGLACSFAAICPGQVNIKTHAPAATSQEPIAPASGQTPSPGNHSRTPESIGQFTLPYEVQCGDLKLAAGQYAVALDRRTKSQTVILTRAGTSVRLPAKAVFPSARHGASAVVVRRTGAERKLEAVYLEKLRLVLYLDSERFFQVSTSDPEVDRLPIS